MNRSVRNSASRNWVRIGLLLALSGSLSGCSGLGQMWWQTAKAAWAGASDASQPTDAEYQYLRGTLDGRSLYLAKGFEDTTREGTVETWYSNRGEVIKLLNGRIVGTAGFTPEWRNVQLNQAPSWDQVLSGKPQDSYRFTRQRDVMPGYDFGVTDTLVTQRTDLKPAPTTAAQVWVEERVINGRTALPPSVFGLVHRDQSWHVIFSKQCLAADFCLTLEQWAPSQSK